MAELKYNTGVMTLEFPSETQVIYFNDIRSDLANYFKEKENIVGLQFETSITKIQDLKVAMLTNAEKSYAKKDIAQNINAIVIAHWIGTMI
jgi:hypothetical protein